MIHDKTDVEHWTDKVDNWSQFDHNDIVIGIDPQERLGSETYSVIRIAKNKEDQVEQMGLFWQKKFAQMFAYAFQRKVEEMTEI